MVQARFTFSGSGGDLVWTGQEESDKTDRINPDFEVEELHNFMK